VPSRADYYSMAIITTINRLLAKNPSSIKLLDALIKFSEAKTVEQTLEEADRISKAYWLPLVGLSPSECQAEQERLDSQQLTDYNDELRS
jgi:hypothetical protein